MLKFTKEISISIDVINEVAGGPAKVSELSERLGVSEYNLHRIIRGLSKAGLVVTSKGKGGGVKSAEKPVTLYDIFLVKYQDHNGGKKYSDDINDWYKECLTSIVVCNPHFAGLSARQESSYESEVKKGVVRVQPPEGFEPDPLFYDEKPDTESEISEILDETLDETFEGGW